MKKEIKIENLKCGGCASTIVKGLEKIEGVTNVEVNVEKSNVTVQLTNETVLEKAKAKLISLGYPEQGTNNSIVHKAKSYVSCAVGKMNS